MGKAPTPPLVLWITANQLLLYFVDILGARPQTPSCVVSHRWSASSILPINREINLLHHGTLIIMWRTHFRDKTWRTNYCDRFFNRWTSFGLSSTTFFNINYFSNLYAYAFLSNSMVISSNQCHQSFSPRMLSNL